MKSIIFNIYNNNSVSTKRFLLVANQLINQNINCYFLDFTSKLYEMIEDHARMLGIDNLPTYIAFDDFASAQKNKITLSSPAKEKKQNISNDSTYPKGYPPNNKLGNILTSLNFDNSALIKHHTEGLLNSFNKDLSTAQNILDIVKPSCTISDLLTPQKNRAVMYAAKQKNIKTISMEHGEGNAEQYDRMPALYDYYIAYSPYNYNKLKEMGVKEGQIFLTGFPETDLIYNYNTEEIKKELSNHYGINFNKKIILVALKPNCSSFYINNNKQLLDKCAAKFNNSNDFQIVVKQHPVDLTLSFAKKNFHQFFSSKYNDMKVIRGDYIISKLFAVSDFFLTLQSSSIVEALLQKIPTIVIENGAKEPWPNWNRFDIYDSIKFDDLDKYLKRIKNGTYYDKITRSENNWAKFVSYFRYKFDDCSTIRITNAIKEIIGMDFKKTNTFQHPNLNIQDEQPLNMKTFLPNNYSSIPKNNILKDRSRCITWEQVKQMPTIRLYAGDVPKMKEYDGMIGLSLIKNDHNHLQHDITQPFPLENNSVDSFQAEDILENIPYEKIIPIINEIYRVLKPSGLFRLSVPDYGCDVLYDRSLKDESGQIVFDPGSGGTPENPGNVWFPRIDTVMQLLIKTKFQSSGKIELLHYYNKDGTFVTKSIDYSKGLIRRTPDFDQRVQSPYRPMSLVIDLIKSTEESCETKSKNQDPESMASTQEKFAVKATQLLEQGLGAEAMDYFDVCARLCPDAAGEQCKQAVESLDELTLSRICSEAHRKIAAVHNHQGASLLLRNAQTQFDRIQKTVNSHSANHQSDMQHLYATNEHIHKKSIINEPKKKPYLPEIFKQNGINIRPKMQTIGTDYGGWAVDLDLIPFGSTIISAGIGEDISFDLGLINLKNCKVIGIDPTEKARRYVENNKHENFTLLQKALYSENNKIIKIYKNTNPDYVSESITPSHHSVSEENYHKAETISLQELLNKYRDVSVLKMDIEGAEYEVLSSISQLDIPQICVEFHHFCTDFTSDDTNKCIEHLQRMGYVTAQSTTKFGAVSEATFVHKKYINNLNTTDTNMGKTELTNVVSVTPYTKLPVKQPSDKRTSMRLIGTEHSGQSEELDECAYKEPRNYNIAGGHKRIYFFHTQKTGGTSLNYMFFSHSEEKSKEIYKQINRAKNNRIISNDKVFVGWNKQQIEQGNYYYAFSHIPKHKLHLPEKTFTITCIRDPVKRILSQYKMILHLKVHNIPHPGLKLKGKWLGNSFSDFLQKIPKEYLLNQLFMFSKNFDVNEAFDNIVGCSHFFFTEQFSSGISQLSKKLGIELKPLHTRKAGIDVDFNRGDIDRLRYMLKEEYILFDKLKRVYSNLYDGNKVAIT